MTQEYRVVLPKLGESIVSATVIRWFKKEGDTVNADEPLLEVSTDKVNSEIPAPASGIIKKILAQPNQEIQVGDALALIATDNSSARMQVQKEEKTITASTQSSTQPFYSPALLRLAREHNISLDELAKIPATGAEGRVSKRDFELYLEKKSPTKPCPTQPASRGEGVEHVKMSGMRKAIAENMVRSFYEAPHASLITEVDVTEIVQFMEHEKKAILEKQGVKLTITPFVAYAIAKALADYPFLNSSLEGDTIALKRFINLGIAVAVDQGILVPVIKQIQTLNILGISKAMTDLAQKARSGKLQPQEVQEGTITLTNFGISGVMIGIPIIRFPEVAIVGMGALHKKVVPINDNTFKARSMIYLSLTFDHRVIDGMYGCGFLNAVKEILAGGHLTTSLTHS